MPSTYTAQSSCDDIEAYLLHFASTSHANRLSPVGQVSRRRLFMIAAKQKIVISQQAPMFSQTPIVSL